MNGRRPNPRALISQILWAMKSKSNRLAAIDAGCPTVANHANGNVAHDVIRGFAPGGLEETKDWYSMVGHGSSSFSFVIPKRSEESL